MSDVRLPPGFAAQRYACDDGLQLHGLSRSGSGPSLSFLSGNGFCAGIYLSLLRRLPVEWSLTAIDMPGQGLSDNPSGFEGAEALIQRLTPQLRSIAGTPGSLLGMGHSFGAVMTLRLAAANPGLFRGLVLLDPVLFPTWLYHGLHVAGRLGLHSFANAARRRRNQWADRQELMAHLRGRGIYRGWTDEALIDFIEHASVVRNGQLELACPPALEAEIFERPAGRYWQAFQDLNIPILILHGRSSYAFMRPSASKAQRLAATLNAKEMPGGHCFMLENPDSSATAISEFVSGLNIRT